ncbi:uncharacterized protein ATC70_004503 [Mucor velutinosus]|uniref:ANK_REP_REGION domain-containing protein n=1 Tax=Mucor velutinosus TaxID=708070 RepID=A0AAN7DSL0_9FUNG|nr:hypothetical protein ATC70_004503 [Mucor velutinosus]
MSTIAVAAMVSPKSQHTSTKPCTSASCCSPSRLWKTVQLLVNTDQRDEFRKLFNDQEKLPHLVRVILTCRLSNNPLVYKNTMKIDARLNDTFGKISATDLNALELALLQKHDHIAFSMLQVLKQNATPAQCKQFINHQWGKQKNTALHLAAFWGMSKIVRLMLEMGADPTTPNNRHLRPIDCTTHPDLIHQLQQSNTVQPEQQQRASPSPPSSLLLKKAERLLRPLQTIPSPALAATDQYIVQEDMRAPIMSPLSFSSSSSSSSSLSSLDHHCWTPPTSPIPHVESPILSLLEEKGVAQQQQQRDALLMERPGCFPRQTVVGVTSIDVDDKQRQLVDDNDNDHQRNRSNDDLVKTVLRKQKKVQFNSETILMDACIRGDQQEMSEYLDLDFGAIRDAQNRSLLHVALMHGHEHLVQFLFDKVDINYSDNDGWTCLHYAAALGLWPSLQFIASLSHCNINARTNHGLKIEDCPESEFGRRKCRIWLERVARSKQGPSSTAKKQLLLKKPSLLNLST